MTLRIKSYELCLSNIPRGRLLLIPSPAATHHLSVDYGNNLPAGLPISTLVPEITAEGCCENESHIMLLLCSHSKGSPSHAQSKSLHAQHLQKACPAERPEALRSRAYRVPPLSLYYSQSTPFHRLIHFKESGSQPFCFPSSTNLALPPFPALRSL